MEQEIEIDVMIADASHEVYVDTILDTIESAAKVRGTGIAKRTHEYVAQKMKEGKAVIALAGNEFAGFSYIESWGNKQYVTTSGLIVHPDFRGLGMVGFPQLRLAVLIQKLLSGELVMLVNKVRFDGGVVRVFRAYMLERCHTVHPELSQRAAEMRSGLQVRQEFSLVSARCPHRQN